MGKISDFYEKHDMLAPILTMLIGLFLFIWFITYGLYKYNVEIAKANIIKVYIRNDIMEEKIIYEGKSAFVEVSSGGFTTTINIYKKLYPIPVIDKIYSDKTIRIEGE